MEKVVASFPEPKRLRARKRYRTDVDLGSETAWTPVEYYRTKFFAKMAARDYYTMFGWDSRVVDTREEKK